MFIQRSRPSRPQVVAELSDLTRSVAGEDVRFVLRGGKFGLNATALLRDGEFVVEAGSLARASWVGVEYNTYAPLYAELERAGVIVPQGSNRVFATDYAFRSPSAAAAVVKGRSTNGATAWKEERSGVTYKEWEARRLGAGEGEAA